MYVRGVFQRPLPRHAGYLLKLLIISLLQCTTYLKRLHGYVLTSAIADLQLVRPLAISGIISSYRYYLEFCNRTIWGG